MSSLTPTGHTESGAQRKPRNYYLIKRVKNYKCLIFHVKCFLIRQQQFTAF